jgi:large subunit ribosomal protein L15
MKLTDLRAPDGARYKAKRVGRGHGSGRMKTSGRGQKGQKARTGSAIPAYFEGGQNRFSQRMPYLGGFKNPFRKEYVVVNLRDLKVFAAGEEVTTATLAEKGLLRQGQAGEMLKVLGEGELDRALKVTAHKVSDSARQQIEAAGGSVTLIEMRTYPKTKRSKEPRATEPSSAPATPAQE